jgi:hypothetical protein
LSPFGKVSKKSLTEMITLKMGEEQNSNGGSVG